MRFNLNVEIYLKVKINNFHCISITYVRNLHYEIETISI